MVRHAHIALAALLGGALFAMPAGAQDGAAARALWDQFAHDCRGVVDAVEPVIFAAGMNGGGGQAGRSEDGRVGMSTIMMSDSLDGSSATVLIASVNLFDDGRVVQCMTQVLQPETDLSALAAIARAEAGALLGAETRIAGGGLVQMTVESGVPLVMPAEDGFEMVRIATTEFPPRGMVTVQVLPQVVILILSVVQPAEPE